MSFRIKSGNHEIGKKKERKNDEEIKRKNALITDVPVYRNKIGIQSME